MAEAMLFEAPHQVPPPSIQTTSMIRALFETREKIDALKRAAEEIEDQLEKLIPPDTGEYVMPLDDATELVGVREETWRWDTEKLQELFATGEVPPFVKRKVSVDREAFEALPLTDQAPLLPLLRRRAAKSVKFSFRGKTP